MKTILPSFLFLLIFYNVNSQDVLHDWSLTVGGTGADDSRSVAVGPNGEVVSTGYFSGVVDFDPGAGVTNLTSTGGWDIYIQKLDANGNLIWAKKIGGSDDDSGNSIVTDALGNVYVSGQFKGTVDFDPGTGVLNKTSAGGDDVFQIKLDPNGNLVWANTYGGTSQDIGLSIKIDNNGNICTSGKFVNVVDFDPGAGVLNLGSSSGSFSSLNTYLQKLDANGSLIWAKSIKSRVNSINNLAVDGSGNFITTGFFSGTVDFDPNAGVEYRSSVSSFDIYVLKLDMNGNFLWANTAGGTWQDQGMSVATDASGNVFVTGRFAGTVDFDPSSAVFNVVPANLSDQNYIQKFDANGTFVWVKVLEGTHQNNPYDITIAPNGDLLSTGYYQGTVDLDPGSGVTSFGGIGINGYIVNLDSSGEFNWAFNFNGSGSVYIKSATYDSNGSLYVAGAFNGSLDADPGPASFPLSASGTNGYVQKYNPCSISVGTDTRTECNSYTWIDGNTYTSSNNTATHVVSAVNGCDSLINLDLTILNSAVGSEVRTECDSYTWIDGNTYMSSNNSATFNIVGGAANGCDSLVTLDLTVLASSSTTDSWVECNSLTWLDGNTYTTSNNTATYIVPNSVGCDSVVTLDLTILGVSNLTVNQNNNIMAADLAGATYQWIDCGNNDQIIAGETNRIFTASTNGNYAVIITEGNCTDTSDCVTVSTIGLETNKWINNVVIFPNPTTGTVHLKGGKPESLSKVTVRNIYGQNTPAQVENFNEEITITIEGAVGIYFIELMSESGVLKTYKVIKK